MAAMASAGRGMRVVYDKEGTDPYKFNSHWAGFWPFLGATVASSMSQTLATCGSKPTTCSDSLPGSASRRSGEPKNDQSPDKKESPQPPPSARLGPPTRVSQPGSQGTVATESRVSPGFDSVQSLAWIPSKRCCSCSTCDLLSHCVIILSGRSRDVLAANADTPYA